jgi:hypothetical protein
MTVCKHCGCPLYPSTLNYTGWTHVNPITLELPTNMCNQVPEPARSRMSEPIGFNEDQRAQIARIVKHRVEIEDCRKKIQSTQTLLDEAEKQWKLSQASHSSVIERQNQQIQFHTEQLKISEDELRSSILNDVIISGTPKPPEPIEEIEPEQENLGRED